MPYEEREAMNDSISPENHIYSRLWDDPDLQDVVGVFATELPRRAETIREHLDHQDWESLRRAAHQLKGAAGSYGFDLISPCAGRIEYAVRDGVHEEIVRKNIEELIDLCSRARSGKPPVAPIE
jgi:histidine phosphotransfer protein HptB